MTLLSVGSCSIKASQAGDGNYAAAAPVVQTLTVGAGAPAAASVLNAASYAAIPIASDGYTVAFGTNFQPPRRRRLLSNSPQRSGTTVKITDSKGVTQTAGLFYVSPTQINFLVPTGLANGSGTYNCESGQEHRHLPRNDRTGIPLLFRRRFQRDRRGSGRRGGLFSDVPPRCCRSSAVPSHRWPAHRLRSTSARLQPASIWNCTGRASGADQAFRVIRNARRNTAASSLRGLARELCGSRSGKCFVGSLIDRTRLAQFATYCRWRRSESSADQH